MAREPDDESTRPPELQPRRTRGRPVRDIPPAPPSSADQSTPAVDRTVLRIVAAHYLTQQERLVLLGTAARFGSGGDGQPYVELPLAADQPPERMPIEGLPPTGTVVHTALVSMPRSPGQEFHVLVCPARTARATNVTYRAILHKHCYQYDPEIVGNRAQVPSP